MKSNLIHIMLLSIFIISCSDNDADEESKLLDTSSDSSGTVTNPVTGRIWMDRNLGASNVASSSTDINSYGSLYQWGRDTDGHELRTSSTTNTVSNTTSPGHSKFVIGYDNWISQIGRASCRERV